MTPRETPASTTSTIGSGQGTASLEVGDIVRVEPADGHLWSGHVTFVSDRIVGLRGNLTVDREFRIRDRVTMHIGRDEELICCRAQVLAASGSLMRLVRRDASEEQDRRRTPRLRVELAASLAIGAGEVTPPASFDGQLVDLSSSGCAVRSETAIRVGTPLRISVPLASTPVELGGTVVRTWTANEPALPHSGIQFDLLPAQTTQLLNRFLVDQLRVTAGELLPSTTAA